MPHGPPAGAARPAPDAKSDSSLSSNGSKPNEDQDANWEHDHNDCTATITGDHTTPMTAILSLMMMITMTMIPQISCIQSQTAQIDNRMCSTTTSTATIRSREDAETLQTDQVTLLYRHQKANSCQASSQANAEPLKLAPEANPCWVIDPQTQKRASSLACRPR